MPVPPRATALWTQRRFNPGFHLRGGIERFTCGEASAIPDVPISRTVDAGTRLGHTIVMNRNGRAAVPSIFELRELAQAAGVGSVAEPAPVRLDDLRRELTENRGLIARLTRSLLEEAS